MRFYLHGNSWISRVEELIATSELSIGLLEKRPEKLVLILGIVAVDELIALVNRQSIVDDYIDPFTELPESEVKYSRISHLKCLIRRNDKLAKVRQHCQCGQSRQKPAISRIALHQIVRVYIIYNKPFFIKQYFYV